MEEKARVRLLEAKLSGTAMYEVEVKTGRMKVGQCEGEMKEEGRRGEGRPRWSALCAGHVLIHPPTTPTRLP